MLGKGLESLIPKKNNQNTNTQNFVNKNDDDIKPFFLPIGEDLDPADEITSKEPELNLPEGEKELELPNAVLDPILPEEKLELDLPIEPKESLLPKPDLQVKNNEVLIKAVSNQYSTVTSNIFSNNNIYSGKDDLQKMKKLEEREQESIYQIEVDKVKPNPSQPRRFFDETALRELANSIREFGFLQPIVVTKKETETPNGIDVSYELIAGERRLSAAKLLGLRLIPAIMRNVNIEREKLELAIIENIQRENLNPIETAYAFQRLQEDFRMTQREIASKLGKSREAVANNVRLLDLPQYIQEAIKEGKLSESHGRFLLAIQDPIAQNKLFNDITIEKLTIRDVKERVRKISSNKSGVKNSDDINIELRSAQDHLSEVLGAPVEIKKGAENGKITITFYSEEELNNIIRKFSSN